MEIGASEVTSEAYAARRPHTLAVGKDHLGYSRQAPPSSTSTRREQRVLPSGNVAMMLLSCGDNGPVRSRIVACPASHSAMMVAPSASAGNSRMNGEDLEASGTAHSSESAGPTASTKKFAM